MGLDLQRVANFTAKNGCRTGNCTWVCAPGTCTSYSSANFLLAGLLLLAHAPQDQRTWQTHDQFRDLGPDFRRSIYKHTHFPAQGLLPQNGLTTAGLCKRDYGMVELFSQDASVLGWCYGYAVSSPRNVAK